VLICCLGAAAMEMDWPRVRLQVAGRGAAAAGHSSLPCCCSWVVVLAQGGREGSMVMLPWPGCCSMQEERDEGGAAIKRRFWWKRLAAAEGSGHGARLEKDPAMERNPRERSWAAVRDREERLIGLRSRFRLTIGLYIGVLGYWANG